MKKPILSLKRTLLRKIIASIYSFLIFISVLAVPLGFGLTSTRAVVIILPFCLVLHYGIVGKKNFSIPKTALLPIIITSIIFIFSSISFILFGGALWPVISWIFLGLMSSLLVVSVYNIDNEDEILVQKIIVLLTMIYCGFEIYRLATNGFLGLGGTSIRRFYGEGALNDLNRTMNTFFVYSAINVGLLYVAFFKGIIWKIFSIVPILISLLLFISSGSRQNTIALVLFVFVLFFYSSSISGNVITSLLKNFKKLLLLLGTILGAITWAIYKKIIDLTFLQERFLPTLLGQGKTSGDEERIDSALRALNASIANGGFGIGPDNFPPPEVHNGYLLLLAENGILGGGITLIIAFSLISYILLVKKNKEKLSVIYTSIFIIIFIWLANLKVLFQDPIFWSLIGIAIAYKSKRDSIVIR